MSAKLDDMDFDLIARETVVAARGKLSQRALSRKLGYRTNQVYRWESGQRQVSWPQFAELCRATGLDLRGALRKLGCYQKDPTDTGTLVRFLLGEAKLAAVAKVSGVSRFSLMRWRNGTATPSLRGIF